MYPHRPMDNDLSRVPHYISKNVKMYYSLPLTLSLKLLTLFI